MTKEQFAEVLSRLRTGGEFTVRNQDGWWGLRGSPDGITAWTRYPDSPDEPDRTARVEEVEAAIGAWDYDAVVARLR